KGEELPAEELRLKYRHLDLRRPEMQGNLLLRHRLLQRARRTLADLEFLEIETPILTKPTPEGARDYLVPSRVHPGEFYALPQSPQIYKQLLMVAGFDRYFQIARCFRDEDLRNDRQPEFTQIDIEASFVGMEDVLGFVETVLAALWEEAGHPVARPFPRITWREAMERYGTDKPDLRYELAIADWTTQVAGLGVPFFESARRCSTGSAPSRARRTPSHGSSTFPCSSPILTRGRPCSRTTRSRRRTPMTSPRGSSRATRSRAARCITTRSTTATSSARGRSGSPIPPYSGRCSRCSGWPRPTSTRGSGSCCKDSKRARPPTAASRSGSIAWSCCWRAPAACAT